MINKYIRSCLLSLLLCATLGLYGCESIVFTNVSENSANEIVSFLSSQGIMAKKTAGQNDMFSVVVDESELARSVELLAAEGLPRTNYDSMGNVFKKEGVVSTPLEENARLIYALSQEVAGSIALIDGVLAARVHVVLPTADVFGTANTPSSASVFIKHRSGVSIESEVARIKQLVENSIQGLTYDNISVFLFSAPPLKKVERAKLVNVLGISVAASSANYVWGLFAACFAFLMLAMGIWIWPRFIKKPSGSEQ